MDNQMEQAFEILYQWFLDKVSYYALKHTDIPDRSAIICPFGRESYIERISWDRRKLSSLEYIEQQSKEINPKPYKTTSKVSLNKKSGEIRNQTVFHVRLPLIKYKFDNLENIYGGSILV